METETSGIVVEAGTLSKTKLSVVVGIPAFNEENAIAHVVLKARKFADTVIVCDDGSHDLTAKIAQRMGAIVIKHERNMGYGAALHSLFRRARKLDADILVTLDGDGQHDPQDIPRVVKPLFEKTADVVIGSRFVDVEGAKEMPRYRRFGAKLITRVVNGSTKKGVSDAQSGFRAYSRQAIERLGVLEVGMGASVEILMDACSNDLRICEVPIRCKYETAKTKTSTEHPLTHGLGVVMSIIRLIVEEKPLIVLGIPGALCLFAGLSFGVWLLQVYSTVHHIVTNIALASLAFTVIGLFAVSTSITIYALLRQTQRLLKNQA